jgi:hypothetical protein
MYLACRRKKLASDEGERKIFRATFERLGKKVNYKGYSEDTILLKNIVDASTNQLVADHLWFSYTVGFESIELREGVVLEFEARVKEYTKGYVNRSLKIVERKQDYKLSHPTKIKKV